MYSRTAILRVFPLDCLTFSKLLMTPVRFYLYALELILSLFETKTKNLKKNVELETYFITKESDYLLT